MRRGLAVVFALALGGWQPFRTTDPDVETGNRAYDDGHYDDALAAYDRAARRGGVDPDGLAYDRGTAELKKAQATTDPAEKRRLTERALDDLKRAGHAKDPHIRGAASYNRGNYLLDQDKLAEAIDAYKQALRDDPELDDARLNLELALRRRQNQQRKQNGQGQGQPGQGQGQQGQGQGQQGQDQGQQGQGSNQQPNGGGQGSNQQPNGGGQGSNPSDPSSGGGGRRNPDPQTGSNGGSRDQASGDPNSSDRDADDPDGPRPRPNRPQRGRGAPHSPKTPAEGKLDDLDDYSRRLQKDQARRRATGHAPDPQHDW